uniref:Glycosyl transferase n=1 Tax=Echinostoma caproni TaxID=27848 RepID=A0A183AKT0_9TREM
LLLKGKPVEALRFCQMRPHLLRQDRSWTAGILTKALNSPDKRVFFSVYRFFEMIDLQNKESMPFLTGMSGLVDYVISA